MLSGRGIHCRGFFQQATDIRVLVIHISATRCRRLPHVLRLHYFSYKSTEVRMEAQNIFLN